MKNSWRGSFNFNRMSYVEYAHAHSLRQAYVIMARRIAKKQGVLPVVVLSYFKNHQNSYKIDLEMEFKENEEVENG